MDHRRIPPAALPVAAFFAAGIVFALIRGGFTIRGLLIGLLGAVVIIAAATMMNRGPYI